MAVTVELSTTLDCPPDVAWARVLSPALLFHISAPLVRFTPERGKPLPDVWVPGEYRFWLHLFGVVPLGWQAVVISLPEPDGDTRFLRDNGFGPRIRQWDHWITIAPTPGGRTTYRDRVSIDAGPRSQLVAAFARQLYGHRQRRWRQLVADNFAALES